MSEIGKIKNKFLTIFNKSKEDITVSEEKVKRYFHTSGILELLDYSEGNIHVEKTVKKGKRTDIHCTDEYGNVTFVIEFKKPSVKNLRKYESELWEKYIKPLKADFGILLNGLELIFYKRIRNNYERLFRKNLKELEDEEVKTLLQKLEKPKYDTTRIKTVTSYFEKFKDLSEKLNLREEASREHFFQSFKLKKSSSFGNLLKSTVNLFSKLYGENRFLNSAYNFWKRSYAKKPDKVPADWKPLMKECDLKENKKDLYKFMFCLETSYALFTRTILAKSGEDYDFPDIKFSGFLKTEVERASHRGDIPQSAWAKITQDLIADMKRRLVSSVFEEDIFYWWTEPFKDKNYNDFFTIKSRYEMSKFGESLAKILLMLYKFDFSEIKGDPLGILYQKYFDKETRKALGEFYTPQEVVDYILDAVDYKGHKILEKRLLDPACGSGTFLVTALQRYLKASESVAEEKGWDYVLDDLCNKYRIVGFDIHPFATIMAQIQFMLVLLPFYKKALEDERHFILQRVPIFRTDSLKKETKGGEITLSDYKNGKKIGMKVELPVQGEKEGFFKEKFEMPYVKTALSETDLHNNEEYFGALQGLFDVVKKQAEDIQGAEIKKFNKKEFERTLKKRYLSNKNWVQLSSFFEPFANDLLEKINKLQTEFDDGRLIKSIEDVFLAALLKNEQKYDFVVGNPPYVRIDYLPESDKEVYRSLYENILSGKWDLYMPFLFRGGNWLTEDGKSGFICSNKFFLNESAKGLREKLLDYNWDKIIDLSGIEVFAGSLPAPAIITYGNGYSNDKINIDIKTDKDLPEEAIEDKAELNKVESALEYLLDNISFYEVPQKRFKQDEEYLFSVYPDRLSNIVEKIESKSKEFEEICDEGIREGDTKRKEEKDVISEEEYKNLSAKEREKYQKVIRGSDVERFYISWESGKRDFIRNLKDISKQKRILIKDYSSRLITAPEYGKYRCLRTIYCATLSKKYNTSIKEIIGQLNSKLEYFYYLCYFYTSRMGAGNFRFREQFVKRLPVMPVENEKLAESVRKIEKRKGLRDKVEKFPKDYLEEVKEKISKQISFEHSHSSISPEIQQRQDGAYNVIIGKQKKEKPIVVNTEGKARFVKLALEGKSVKKDGKIKVLVPKSNKVVKEILKEYEKDKKKLEEMPSVEELEDEINQIVYDLYGLSEEDVEVIEEFLEKF